MGDYHFWLDHFLRASLLAKIIYLILAILSVSAWAIIIRKLRLLRRCRIGSLAFTDIYHKGRRNPLALQRHILANRENFFTPLADVFLKGCEELRNQLERGGKPAGAGTGEESRKITTHQLGIITKHLEAAEDKYFLDLEHLLIHLATTISVAPFLGLLGTVWGILVAFQEMGRQASTGMTAFGPGISEALVSTVSGLLVAIPALLGYNYIGSRIRELAGDTTHFSTDFLALLEKEYVQE
jgi:biopolymer transport protein TolQ